MHAKIVWNLAMLRDEFRASALRGDARFFLMNLVRTPLVKEDGTVDMKILSRITNALRDGREALFESTWYTQEDERGLCIQSLVLSHAGETHETFERLVELIAGTVRCLLQEKQAVADFFLEEVDSDDPDSLYAEWLSILQDLATPKDHPILYSVKYPLVYSQPLGKSPLVQIGPYTIPLHFTEPPALERWKGLCAATDNEIDVILCGLLRGSASAIEIILSRYAH
jgi:hypothetical protein